MQSTNPSRELAGGSSKRNAKVVESRRQHGYTSEKLLIEWWNSAGEPWKSLDKSMDRSYIRGKFDPEVGRVEGSILLRGTPARGQNGTHQAERKWTRRNNFLTPSLLPLPSPSHTASSTSSTSTWTFPSSPYPASRYWKFWPLSDWPICQIDSPSKWTYVISPGPSLFLSSSLSLARAPLHNLRYPTYTLSWELTDLEKLMFPNVGSCVLLRTVVQVFFPFSPCGKSQWKFVWRHLFL